MKYATSLSTLAFVLAVPAAAQQAPSGDEAIIVAASRATQDAGEIGTAVTVISERDLDRNQITFVKDALQDVPGVIISTDRPGDFSNVSIRGSNNDEVLWLVDGIELGDPSSTSTQFQADHLIAADVSRIEVLRGNQSSLYGSDAIGGVINIVTKRATEDGVGLSAEAEGGSHGTLGGGASLLGKSGALDFRATVNGYRHDGPSLTDPVTGTNVTEDDGYSRYGASGRVGLAVSDSFNLQALGFWLDSSSDLDNTGTDSLNTVDKREFAFAGQAQYANGGFAADLTGSRYVARRLYFGTFNRPEGDVYEGTKDKLALDVKYDTGGFISVAAGGELEWEDTDQITNFSGNFVAGIDTKSAYAEVAVRPVENLTFTGAARLDDNSRFGEFDTYRVTGAYQMGAAKLRASYGTGAKAPGLYQLFDPTYGNQSLQVEESEGGDIGMDVSLGNGIALQASYFFLRKTNEIVFDGSRPPFGGYAQYGQTRASGFEFGMNARLTDWASFNQSFTQVDHEVLNTTTGMFGDSDRPNYIGSSSLVLTPVAGADLTVRARYRDGDGSGFGGDTDSYFVVDLLGSYDLTDRIELYGRVVNLFDRFYQVTYGTNTLGLSAYGGVRVNF